MSQYLPLYEKIPNQLDVPNVESEETSDGILRISKVSVPAYQYFRAKNDDKKRPCVIICPGGGYWILAAGHEGVDVAKYFNSIGINAMVLKYRIPNDKNQIDKSIAPLQDIQQAFYLARKNAITWGIDMNKIGVMGFSAGGHLAASASTHYLDIKIDNKESLSLRPDFQILIYPVISVKSFGHDGSKQQLIGTHPSGDQLKYFSNEDQVNSKTPPAFIVHTKDDEAVPVKNAEVYYQALIENKVSAQLFLFEKGGHGFGMQNDKSQKQWPPILEAWLHEQNILK
jgi:acetyl esterase/lipase